MTGRLARLVHSVALVLILALAAQGLFRKITWYLAIDQYGYLTFGGDLARGTVFHAWPPVEDLASYIKFPRVDVLSQTHVFTGDRMYCRYTPGFPIVLAAWMRLFGPNAAHYLDPILFLVLLCLWLALARRLLAPTGVAGPLALVGGLLLLLLPSYLHLWAITILRDTLAQLLAIAALLAALPRSGAPMSRGRAAAVGFLLGYLVTTRIDAALYALPVGALVLMQKRRPGALAVAATLAALGLAPLLTYNYLATGNPLRPTQSMEVESFFQARWQVPLPDRPAAHVSGLRRLFATPEAHAAADATRAADDREAEHGAAVARPYLPPVQGGGLKLSNLPVTLPGNIRYVRGAFGNTVLLLAGLGAIGALATNRLLFVATVPYIVVALLFYSCWGRADPRYIAGLFLLTPLLALAGFATLSRLSEASVRWGTRGRLLAVAMPLLLAVVFWPELIRGWQSIAAAWQRGDWGGESALAATSAVVALVSILATVIPLLLLLPFPPTVRVDAGRRGCAVAATLLVALLLVVAVARVVPGLGRSPVVFQGSRGEADVVRARANIERLVEVDGVVITTADVGRPAENIDYYTHAHAVYAQDLERWGLTIGLASLAFLERGRSVYLFFPTGSPLIADALHRLRVGFEIERLARIPAGEAPAYFVASRFGTTSMDLHRVRLSPRFLDLMRRHQTAAPPPSRDAGTAPAGSASERPEE
jgi:hypothetical protein